MKIRDAGRVLSRFNSTDGSVEIIHATVTSFLENFGELIRELRLDYKQESQYEDAHHWREVEGVVAKYCTKTLRTIRLENYHGNVMEEIQKPFKRLGTVEILNGFTEPTKTNFNDIFPTIQYLLPIGYW